jgi:hypothetical protein
MNCHRKAETLGERLASENQNTEIQFTPGREHLVDSVIVAVERLSK